MEALKHGLDFIDQIIWLGVPGILKGIIIALLISVIFKKAIKKYSGIFYIYPGIIFIWYVIYGIGSLFAKEWFEIFDESIVGQILWLPNKYMLDTVIGVGFITIVMFIGVLPKTKLVKELFTIRKELSIIGGFFLVGHGIMRLSTAFETLKGENNKFLFIGYGIMGFVILILITIPWITSFDFIRRSMKAKSWKKMQTYTSVPLFVLMLIFGAVLNTGWGVEAFTSFGTDLWDVKTAYGINVDSVSPGYNMAVHFLSVKIYLAMTGLYIYLRVKKYKKQTIKES